MDSKILDMAKRIRNADTLVEAGKLASEIVASHAALEAEVERLRVLADGGDGLSGHTWKAMWNGLRRKIEDQREEIASLESRLKALEEAGRRAIPFLRDGIFDWEGSKKSVVVLEELRRALEVPK